MFVWSIIIIVITILISLSFQISSPLSKNDNLNNQNNLSELKIQKCFNQGLFGKCIKNVCIVQFYSNLFLIIAFFIIGNVISLMLIFYVIYDCIPTIRQSLNDRQLNPKTLTSTISSSLSKSISILPKDSTIISNQMNSSYNNQRISTIYQQSHENPVKFLSRIPSIATPQELKSKQQSLAT